MIRLTRLNGSPLAMNADLLKFVENAPDTVLTLTSGEKIVVRESAEDIIQKVVEYKRSLLAGLPASPGDLVSKEPALRQITESFNQQDRDR